MRIPPVFCGSDYREMKCIKTGAIAETRLSNDDPYYKIAVDIFECSYCLAQVVIPAKEAIAQAHSPGYNNIKRDFTLSFIN